MAPRALYLYEVVDIIGQGQYEYMELVAREPVQRMPSMMKLQGSFFVIGAGGGRWPQCINVWDIGEDGWEGWGRNIDRLNLKRRRAFYGEWWDEAARWRSGGFDRLCGGAPGSPTTAEIAERGIKGTLFLNELLTVRPGSQLEFLAAVADQRMPLMQEYGHEAVGLYEVLSNQHEVVMLWATTVESQVRLRRSRDAARALDDGDVDDRLTEWDRLATTFVTGGDAHLMTPLPGTVYGPDGWEEATLSQWE